MSEPLPRWRFALITGASSGIGLALCARLLERTSACTVFALARSAEESPALESLQARHPGRLHRLAVDLTEAREIDALAERLATEVDRLDLVINAAGLLHDPQGLTPEKSLQQLELSALQRSFALNAFAPALLLRALLPLLRREQPAVYASLSARVGSIGDNRLGGWYSYRAAKAAQNQLLRTASIELRRLAPQLCVVMLHPGTVDTPLSAPFQRGVPADRLFAPERAADQLLDVLGGLGPGDSGRFIAWDGSDVPW